MKMMPAALPSPVLVKTKYLQQPHIKRNVTQCNDAYPAPAAPPRTAAAALPVPHAQHRRNKNVDTHGAFS